MPKVAKSWRLRAFSFPSAFYGSLEELAWEIHERVWNFFSFNLSCNSLTFKLGAP
jgi:hypothetical protein